MEAALAIALVTGLTEIIKRAFDITGDRVPLVSMAFAFGLMFLGWEPGTPVRDIVIGAIVVGLAANGLYSGPKAVISANRKR